MPTLAASTWPPILVTLNPATDFVRKILTSVDAVQVRVHICCQILTCLGMGDSPDTMIQAIDAIHCLSRSGSKICLSILKYQYTHGR